VRALWALVLGGVVAFGGRRECAGFKTLPATVVADVCNARCLEGIVISYFAEKPNHLLPVADGRKIDITIGQGHRDLHAVARAKALARGSFGVGFGSNCGIECHGSRDAREQSLNTGSGSLAEISNNECDGIKDHAWLRDGPAFYVDISPQLPLRGFVGIGNQLVGSGGQTNCENGQHDREKGNDRPVVIVKESSTLPDDDARHFISGAIFLSAVVGLILLAIGKGFWDDWRFPNRDKQEKL
jgi:hypothetical protein